MEKCAVHNNIYSTYDILKKIYNNISAKLFQNSTNLYKNTRILGITAHSNFYSDVKYNNKLGDFYDINYISMFIEIYFNQFPIYFSIDKCYNNRIKYLNYFIEKCLKKYSIIITQTPHTIISSQNSQNIPKEASFKSGYYLLIPIDQFPNLNIHQYLKNIRLDYLLNNREFSYKDVANRIECGDPSNDLAELLEYNEYFLTK